METSGSGQTKVTIQMFYWNMNIFILESGEDVAVKIELKNRTMLQLPLEQKIYQILNNGAGAAGFPKSLFYGEGQLVNILVMELLGSTLEDLFRYCNKQFSLKTVIMLFDQLLSRIGMSY